MTLRHLFSGWMILVESGAVALEQSCLTLGEQEALYFIIKINGGWGSLAQMVPEGFLVHKLGCDFIGHGTLFVFSRLSMM